MSLGKVVLFLGIALSQLHLRPCLASQNGGKTFPFPEVNMSGTTPSSSTTQMEHQIIGSIPIEPAIKLGLMSLISTLLLPGVHLTLTLITIIFALIGITAFLCTSFDCLSYIREDPFGQPSKMHRYMPNNSLPKFFRQPWDSMPPLSQFTQTMESAFNKFHNDPRKE